MHRSLAVCLSAGLVSSVPIVATAGPPTFTYDLDEVAVFDSEAGGGGAEIVAFDTANQLILVTNGEDNRIDIFDADNPSGAVDTLDLSSYGGVQSVAVKDGLAVAAVAGETVVDDGFAVFFDPTSPTSGTTEVQVGALPDMVTFTPNGRYVLVANEGEPRCVDVDGEDTTDPEAATDPEGSISVIAINGGAPGTVSTADFTAFNSEKSDLQEEGVRLTWPGATVAEDLEPEYITVDKRSRTAFVSLQENNALAIVDIRAAEVTDVVALGLKDYGMPGNEIDASNKDDPAPNFQNWPVMGMYQPDGLDSWFRRGSEYIVTANEGDGREYVDNIENDEDISDDLCFIDEARVKDITLDTDTFDSANDLQQEKNLGRLKVSQVALSEFEGGTPPADGSDPKDVDGLEFTALASYGARSITIWDTDGNRVWDSGSDLARTVADHDPDGWRDSPGPWTDEEFYDDRSDDKGVEPESVVHGKAYGRDLLFVGLERAGGIVTYDATDPRSPTLQQWTTTDDAVSPEGLVFVSDEDSPTGRPLLLVAHEESGNTVMYEVVKRRS